MNRMTVMKRWCLAMPLAAFAVGCGVEQEAPGTEGAAAPVAEETGETTQAVGVENAYWWGTTANGYTSTNIGPTTGRTCFLSGLQGNLKPAVAGRWATGGVLQSAGDYILFVSHNNSKALGVGVQCIYTSAGRTTEMSWAQGQAARLLGAVTAQRRCFLTQVTASGGFASNSDYVRVWNDGLNWYLGGNLSGAGGGRAVCVNVPEDHGGWLWIAGDPGGFTETLAYNPGGVACALSGVGGKFDDNSFTDGVSVDYNAGTRYWEMSVMNGKRGWGNCVK
ncbi:hypothetical protein OWM54_37630 [Myxococcus sp. MISCRS1]|uniref:hypothetical protein n=1 Tax=Myxococcus sp. MISCRS1 TaxID=2996786 RepID=UPI0022717F42|nr:hypothetical protein [Myxococcus sp. MISCRS1]MCY1002884.1 hypothetical protein [Myxococcus sp. MISCRS1]